MRASPFKLLCAAGLLAIFSSTISKSPVLPLYAAHLGAAPAGVGLVASVSAFTGIVASIPAGLLSDRLGRRRLLVFSAVIFATAPFLYLLVTDLWQLALIRFYHGFATAVFIPVGMALVSDLSRAARGERLGWFSTSTLAGRFAAPLLGGAIIGVLAYDPGLGYRAVYLLCGVAGVAALLLTLRVPEPVPPVAAPAATGRGISGAAVQTDGDGQRQAGSLTALRSVISNRAILITAMVEAGILFAYGTFETFLPLFALESGLSAYQVGIFLSAQIITLALTKPVMGRFSDKHSRPPQIAAGGFLGAASIGSAGLFTSFAPLLLVSIAFGLSLSIVTSATSALIADLSVRESRGSAMGVLGSVMDIGHTTGPLAAGAVAGIYGFGRSFMGAAAVLVALSLLFLVTVAAAPRRPASQAS